MYSILNNLKQLNTNLKTIDLAIYMRRVYTLTSLLCLMWNCIIVSKYTEIVLMVNIIAGCIIAGHLTEIVLMWTVLITPC